MLKFRCNCSALCKLGEPRIGSTFVGIIPLYMKNNIEIYAQLHAKHRLLSSFLPLPFGRFANKLRAGET